MGAAHHASEFSEEDRRKQAELMDRFIGQVEKRAKREYSKGRLGADDDGDLAFAIAADPKAGIVRIDFGKSVTWLGLGPKEAMALAEMLISKAREISQEPLSVNL